MKSIRTTFTPLIILALLLSGCGGVGAGPGGEMSCAQYEALRGDDWFLGRPENKEQKDVIIRMLRDKDRNTGDSTVSFVHTGISTYCTGASKKNNAIENSFDWTKNPLEIEIGW